MKNKIAIVTGGSSGIGKFTAISLYKAGCKVYELSRRENAIEGVCHIGADVTDEVSICAAIERVIRESGGIDILVNCAGNGISGAIEFTKSEAAKLQFEVNFFGMANMNRAVLKLMREQGYGRIVNISSVAAVAHIPFQAYYSASKAAVESYTCSLANEVRPYGITVTCVQPGDIATGFTEARCKFSEGDDIYGGRISKSVAGMEKDEINGMSPLRAGEYIKKIALKRRVKPIYTLGFGYKCLSLLCKILPCRFRNWVVGLLYAR